ncbi:MAG: rod shape-determining protein MreC [Synechococcales cyanobacterium RU_4_20]|nr:rod shape-determining protein MreC [Synechococcales cyanobacterium RU_4_20]NJR68995.1 rod shape-determining protein MreC [Synechococcales cyanobacterium CRU_2_2]
MLNQWWNQYWTKFVLVGAVVGAAWGLSQTQGAVLEETYFYLTRPLQFRTRRPPDWLSSSQVLELQERLLEAEAQNATLNDLLSTIEDRGKKGEILIPAPIIGRSADQWWQQIRLGRGQRHGIERGAAVTGAGGLVGYVVQSTPNTSKVLLISDPSSSVGAMVVRTRAQGYVRGKATDQVEMSFFDKDPGVKAGDVVVTSASSTLFLPGIPIGIVKEVQPNASPVPKAVIQLNAPIGRLEWVTVSPLRSFAAPEASSTPTPTAPATPENP